MPSWLIQALIQLATKYITPEAVKALEDAAMGFVMCKLKAIAVQSPSALDDMVLQKVADAVGFDLSKCAV